MINNKLTKKYYSASEVIKHLNIALHQLRYLEAKSSDLSSYKINNRKYYTANDIDLLQKALNKDITSLSTARIDILLTNFHNLSLQIKNACRSLDDVCIVLVVSRFKEKKGTYYDNKTNGKASNCRYIWS
ncbi:hypothetical protein FLA4_01590 [Candidatus Rickettsia kotlanii]|nr:hypothetical protein FLA4_01590 [Candidatus Rickettsia kotlanii]BDU60991.1 hypothetical protein HM2_01590 [Candidatus Rickettsia kotlanii]